MPLVINRKSVICEAKIDKTIFMNFLENRGMIAEMYNTTLQKVKFDKKA